MVSIFSQTDLVAILNSLTKIPLRNRNDQDAALKEITELGRQALGLPACTLTFIDYENKCLIQKACSGFDDIPQSKLQGRKFKFGLAGDGCFIDKDLIEKGEIVKKTNLQAGGQGVINHSVAKKYGLNSILAYPLKLYDHLVGYFNCFSSDTGPFSQEQIELIEPFAHFSEITIERDELFGRSLKILNDLLKRLLTPVNSKAFLSQVAEKACEFLNVPICIVWKLDVSTDTLKVEATSGEVSDQFKQIELHRYDKGVKAYLDAGRATYFLSDVTVNSSRYSHSAEAAANGWVSLLSAPMYVNNQLIGMLDLYTHSKRLFKEWEKDIFSVFAKQAAISIQEAEHNNALHEKKRQDLITKIRSAVDAVDMAIKSRHGDLQAGELNELRETLNLIVKECASATPANTSHIRLLNRATDSMELKAVYPPQPSLSNHSLKLGQGIAGHVGQTGMPYICEDTSNDSYYTGFFIDEKPKSILCVPIKSGKTVIGTLSVGSNIKGAFRKDEQQLLEGIINSVSVAIERAYVIDGLLSLAKASANASRLDDLLKSLVMLTRDLMKESICLVWILDKSKNGFSMKAFTGPESQRAKFDDLIIKKDANGMDGFLKRRDPLCLRDVSRTPLHPYHQTIKMLDWKSMLAIPLRIKDRVIGILEVYTWGKSRDFSNWHRKLFKALSVQASVAIENLTTRERLNKLNSAMQKLAGYSDLNEFLRAMLTDGLELVGGTRGWISLLNPRTGELKLSAQTGAPQMLDRVMFGEEIEGHALKISKPIRIEDTRMAPDHLKAGVQKFGRNTSSVMTVPILIPHAKVRQESNINEGPKPIGVFTMISPTLNAFSQADEDIIWALNCHAAQIIDRLKFDRTLSSLTEIQRHIVGRRDFNEIIQILMDGIIDTLEYKYVNISMVTPDRKRIKTEYVKGIPDADVDIFKQMADHEIDSNDIQAEVAREKNIIVPGQSDHRFDEEIFERFGHKKKIRVYIPMINTSTNRVIGTVEAGYERKYRKYVYERDVQILKNFVDYVVMALEQRNTGVLEKITHEFFLPIEGIRNNASFLQRRFQSLVGDPSYFNRKLRDILVDSEILLQQVYELEYILGYGRSFTPPKRTQTLVFRDIVIKTVNELKPLITAQGFDISKVEYKEADIGKILVYLDPGKLNQVVYNLLMNSLKYADKEPGDFRVRLGVEETKDDFVIVFKDWGMGIEKQFQEKVFEDGFRTPKAVSRNVSGSGLGLTIARKAIREMGGDLILANNYKPTEFHILIPKKLKERTV